MDKSLFDGHLSQELAITTSFAELFTQGEHQLRPKSQESVLVGDHEPPDFSRGKSTEEKTQALLVMVGARACP